MRAALSASIRMHSADPPCVDRVENWALVDTALRARKSLQVLLKWLTEAKVTAVQNIGES